MTRQIRIVHHTGYAYQGGVSASHNEARMTPRSSREQWVSSSRIDVEPTPWLYTYTDYWGTQVTTFEIRERHSRLNVRSTATVEVTREAATPPGTTWEALSDPVFSDVHIEMLQVGGLVDPGAELRTMAEEAARTLEPSEVVSRVIERVRDRIEYQPGLTGVQTHASDAWEAKAGVCQDMVHLVLGAVRSVGIPARYVSGYVMPSADPVVGETRNAESHAWLHYWDGSWVGIDPTNDSLPGEFHVEVGIGRDYSDVPPLRGIYSGGSESDLYVDVEMTVLS